MLFPARTARLCRRWSGKLLVSLLLLFFASAGVKSVYAQAGHLTPAQEAWLRQVYASRTGSYDQAAIDASSWTNFYSSYSNDLHGLFGSGFTNVTPVYGTNFGASYTGHMLYVLFRTNYTAASVSYTNSNQPTFQTVQDALDSIFYVAPSVSLSGGGSYEIGRVVTNVNLSWTCNRAMVSRELSGAATVSFGAGQNGSYTHTNALISSGASYTMTVNDGSAGASSGTSVSFYNRRYWGTSTTTNMPSDVDIKAWTSELSNTKGISSKTIAITNAFVMVAYNTTLGTCSEWSDGTFTYTAIDMGTTVLTNSYGAVITNQLYRWPNVQTRTATVSLY